MQDFETKRPVGLQTLVYAVLLVILVGYLLVIGKSILVPIFIAVISVYILVRASDWLGRQHVTGVLPVIARRIIVLLAFILAILALTGVVISTAGQIVAKIPFYQQNLSTLADGLLIQFGIDVPEDWDVVWDNTMGRINLQSLAGVAVGRVGSLAGVVILVVVYAIFLLGERQGFGHKISVALPGPGGRQSKDIIASINESIGTYLAVKTLINAILASISFGVMWVFGVDFALFWAILIGLLNYIPYIGSLIGVLFPVALTLAQFGTLKTTVFVLILLTAAQMWVGNYLEPKMIGKKVNLSPFIVLVSLSLWTSLWGIAGSILAIPMTAMLAIILSHFAATRPISVLLSDNPDLVTGGDPYDSPPPA